MPTYDYKCAICGQYTEINKKISERDDTKLDGCPHCLLAGSLERQLSAPLVAYSLTSSNGYGSRTSLGGFRDVLQKVHEQSPGSRLDKTSSFW